MTTSPLSVTRLLDGGTDTDQVRELLRDVIDPELGVDIVSLGLVYGVELSGRTAAVLVTTTTPACPLGDYLCAEIERVVLDSGMADRVAVQITHRPPWTPGRMAESTRRAFGWS